MAGFMLLGRKRWRHIVASVGGVLLLSCSDHSTGRLHNASTVRLLPTMPAADTLHLVTRPDTFNGTAGAVAITLPDSPESVIGALDAPRHEVFGRIADGLIDGSGRIVVLDSYAGEARTFNVRGSLLYRVGRRGAGPGEFMQALALASDDSARIFVFDSFGRIHLFETGGDSALFKKSLSFAGDPLNGCTMGGQLFVHGMQMGGGHAIHTFGVDGDARRSFAELYRTDNRVVQHQLSRGRIACLSRPHLILYASTLLPDIYAYSPSGVLEWWIAIEGFRSVQVTESAKGGSVLRIPPDGHDLVVTLVSSPDGHVAILQIARIEGGRTNVSARSHQLHTFVISTTHRKGFYVGQQWPKVLHWGKDLLLASRDAPHPQILVYRLRTL